MKKLTKKEKTRMNEWKFFLIQFGHWKKEDDHLFERLIHKEDK